MCLKDFVFFIMCYKVIDVYLGNVHFHNTDTLLHVISTPFQLYNQSAL